MTVRSRSRVLGVTPNGTADRFTWVYDTSDNGTFNRAAETCIDVSPSHGGGPLTVVRDYCEGGVIDMPLTNYFAGYFHNYTCDFLKGGSWKQGHLGTDSPSDTDIANLVQKGSNPSRPWVDIVASIAQLPQGVSAIKESFRQFYGLGKVAQTYLKYKFDVAPNVSDLIKILLFQGKVDDRIKELERLKKRGLRRTITVGEYEQNRVENYPVQSNNRYISVELRTHTTERCWGYITWTPDAEFPANADDMRRLAVAATYGITIDAGTAWELIPWSWLMDWCTSFGDYFAATRNIIPATPSPVQVMRETRTRFEFDNYVDNSVGLTMSKGYAVSERKLRTLKSPSVEAHMPLLTGEHASILASIGVLSGNTGSGRRYRYR